MSRALYLLLTASLGGAVMSAALWCAGRALRRLVSHRALRLMWAAAIVRFLLPLPGLVALTSASPAAAVISSSAPAVTTAAVNVQLTYSAAAGALPDITTALFLAWATGAVLCAAYRLCTYMFYRRRVLSSAVSADDTLCAMLHDLGGGRARLMVSAATYTPVLLGALRPVIVLPDRPLADAELRLVLGHEVNHMKSGDIALKWLALAAACVHWFDPFALLARRELDAECELGCDEKLMATMDGPARLAYGRVLLRIAGSDRAPCAAAMSAGKGRMKRRMTAIADYRPKNAATVILSVLTACAILCAGLIIGAQAAPAADESGTIAAVTQQPNADIEALPVTAAPEPTLVPSEETAAAENNSTAPSESGMCWPCPDCAEISATFGERVDPVLGTRVSHNGVDIAAPEGSAVVAAMDGTVSASEYTASEGYYIVLDHAGGVRTFYAHLSCLLAEAGDTVTAGQQIAESGSTGWATGAHLHFGVSVDGEFVDPVEWFK